MPNPGHAGRDKAALLGAAKGRVNTGRVMKGRIFLTVVLFALATVGSAAAQGWRMPLVSHSYGPPRLLAIDKGKQVSLYLEQKSPLAVVNRFPCATGQVPGDKTHEGDLRTPEGVYFVERRLDQGLDFDLYGDFALTLNYPNPVDRINGKTGHGIWLHGRGHPIEPRETKGCVALNQPDLDWVSEFMIPKHTPVAIADELVTDPVLPEAINEDAREIADLVHAWAGAWSSRSDEFFEFYDPEKFSIAQGRPFSAVKRRKQRIFQAAPWIEVMVHDLRLVAGPDYYVSYFKQYYRTPSMTSQGVKRIYWQKDRAGQWRIVGSEWISDGMDLEQYYLAEVEREVTAYIQDWRNAWEKADLDEYLKFYHQRARQGEYYGQDGIAGHKRQVWSDEMPAEVDIGPISVALHPRGVRVEFEQAYKGVNGYRDKGHKTVVLEPHGNTWLIVEENWRAS